MTSLNLALGTIRNALEAIPQEQKVAYSEALIKAPQLVESESNPIKFIQTCSYNVCDAALRLVKYWDERKQLFGDRAFLPMTQTGDGALSPTDLVLLHAGYPALIPGNNTNGPVFLLDRRRNLSSSSKESRLRCAFYLLTVASEDVRTRIDDGLSVFCFYITPRVLNFDQDQAIYFVTQILNQVAPCKTTLHLFETMPKGKNKQTILDELSRTGMEIRDKFNGRTKVHRETNPGKIRSELIEGGFFLKSIPASVGGEWNYEDFTNRWCKDRAVLERRQLGRQEILSVNFDDMLVDEAIHSEDNNMDANQRRQMINVVRSRRKRERGKQKLSTLSDEKSVLMEEIMCLQTEVTRLKAALAEARKQARSLECNSSYQSRASPSREEQVQVQAAAVPQGIPGEYQTQSQTATGPQGSPRVQQLQAQSTLVPQGSSGEQQMQSQATAVPQGSLGEQQVQAKAVAVPRGSGMVQTFHSDFYQKSEGSMVRHGSALTAEEAGTVRCTAGSLPSLTTSSISQSPRVDPQGSSERGMTPRKSRAQNIAMTDPSCQRPTAHIQSRTTIFPTQPKTAILGPTAFSQRANNDFLLGPPVLEMLDPCAFSQRTEDSFLNGSGNGSTPPVQSRPVVLFPSPATGMSNCDGFFSHDGVLLGRSGERSTLPMQSQATKSQETPFAGISDPSASSQLTCDNFSLDHNRFHYPSVQAETQGPQQSMTSLASQACPPPNYVPLLQAALNLSFQERQAMAMFLLAPPQQLQNGSLSPHQQQQQTYSSLFQSKNRG